MTGLEDTALSVDRACQLAAVSRAGYYRAWQEHEPLQAEVELRGRIQQICLDHRLYGTRRVTKRLRQEGVPVCRKRVQRLMRLDNLLALRKRRYVLTTDSRHSYAVYPNLAEGFEPTTVNQLWVGDITYIRLRESFVYLAILLDAWSRRVVGGRWARAWKRNWSWSRSSARSAAAARFRGPFITPIVACSIVPSGM